jgi:broad-specificity NMP kinase
MSIVEQISKLERENVLLKKKFEDLKSKLTNLACEFISLNEAIQEDKFLTLYDTDQNTNVIDDSRQQESVNE